MMSYTLTGRWQGSKGT